jgi:hypothetical protein
MLKRELLRHRGRLESPSIHGAKFTDEKKSEPRGGFAGRYVAKVCQFVNVRGAKHMEEGAVGFATKSRVEVSAVRKFLP